MKEVRLSANELATQLNVVYETVRGILKGDRPPSKLLLREICRILTLDFETMNEMLVTEQIKRKFGRVSAMRKSDPGLQLVEEAWPLLLPEEKEHVVLLVEKYADRTRKHQPPSSAPRIVPRPVR
jgi:transcriptional regulator with XRE-family HTH domain